MLITNEISLFANFDKGTTQLEIENMSSTASNIVDKPIEVDCPQNNWVRDSKNLNNSSGYCCLTSS